MTSPGTQFILDLLAKSVAKINAATESSTGTRPTSKKKKRKHKTDEEIPKKKVKSKHTDYEDPDFNVEAGGAYNFHCHKPQMF